MRRVRNAGEVPVRRVLAVASVPPPVAGQSLATVYFLEALPPHVAVSVVDLSDSIEDGGASALLVRAARMSLRPLELLWKSRFGRGAGMVFYLQVGQSRASMIRDLPFIVIARALGWRMIGHLHGGNWRSAFDELPPGLKHAVAWGIRSFDSLLVLTPSAEAMVSGLVERERVRVVSNSVDRELERAAADYVPARGGEATVLYLGNLIGGKGIETLGDVARLASARGSDLRFVVAGYGNPNLLGALEGTNCDYVGPVDLEGKVELLKEADVLVLPSELREGQPISVLEAMHFGLPVVATHSGGLADMITTDSGRSISPRDPRSTLRAIEEVLRSDEWERISANNRAEAQREHSVEAFARTMRALVVGGSE